MASEKPIEFPECFSKDFVKFIHDCTKIQPKERPSAEALLVS